jgi:hypothetical protein
MGGKMRTLALAFALFLLGCQSSLKPVTIDPTTVPEETYNVTVHASNRVYYAVLFDIPDDGKPVVMMHTYATERVGTDAPGAYIDHLNSTVRNYRTLQIEDLDGTVRAYLMISNLLDYFVIEREKEGRIVIYISDPNLGDGRRRIP